MGPAKRAAYDPPPIGTTMATVSPDHKDFQGRHHSPSRISLGRETN